MNRLSHVASHSAAILRGTRNFIARGNLHNQSYTPWKISSRHLGIKSVLTRFRVQCYSSRSSTAKKSHSRKLKTEPEMEQGKDEYFVVRKGDVVAVYKSLTECQAQVGSSICHPPVSVYKGYSMPKGTEEYLTSHGLKNALYTIRAADLTEDLFGSLLPCTLQDPTSKKRPQDKIGPEIGRSCVLEFDGASKGNRGPAGAAAVLRTDDGNLICTLREGLGMATNNVAEYRALILGLKYALEKGYFNIRVQGDSRLVCMQVAGSWKPKHQRMVDLCGEARRLREKFLSFQITHVLRNLNSEADAQANLAVSLADGQVAEECTMCCK